MRDTLSGSAINLSWGILIPVVVTRMPSGVEERANFRARSITFEVLEGFGRSSYLGVLGFIAMPCAESVKLWDKVWASP